MENMKEVGAPIVPERQVEIKKNGVENTLDIIAVLVLILGVIAAAAIFVNDVYTAVTTAVTSVTSWAVLRVLSNIAYTLRKIEHNQKK